MTENVLNVWGEIIAVGVSVFVLLIFAIALSFGGKPRVPPGSKGFRVNDPNDEAEVVRPDGYIDSFAGVIQEAGGSLTPVVQVAAIGVLSWWLIYLIVNWTPHIYDFMYKTWLPHLPYGG